MEQTIVSMHARVHEQARVVSAGFQLHAGDAAALTAAIESAFAGLLDWCGQQDVLVGHVKGFCAWGDGKAAMLTTTGGPVQRKGDEPPAGPQELDAGMVCILFGAPLETVAAQLEALARQVLDGLGISYTVEHEVEDEHHHHHHHEHGEACTCGEHGHHHHHGHDGACTCGEHHHHEHGEGCDGRGHQA